MSASAYSNMMKRIFKAAANTNLDGADQLRYCASHSIRSSAAGVSAAGRRARRSHVAWCARSTSSQTPASLPSCARARSVAAQAAARDLAHHDDIAKTGRWATPQMLGLYLGSGAPDAQASERDASRNRLREWWVFKPSAFDATLSPCSQPAPSRAS